MARVEFSWAHFFLRLVFALVLVGATYNPTDYSYFRWAIAPLPAFGPEQAVAGIVLLIGWIIFLRATLRSLGPIGIGLAVGLMAALIWVLFSWGVLSTENPTVLEYVVLVVISILLAVGMSWSYIRRRMTGQSDVDDIDN